MANTILGVIWRAANYKSGLRGPLDFYIVTNNIRALDPNWSISSAPVTAENIFAFGNSRTLVGSNMSSEDVYCIFDLFASTLHSNWFQLGG